MDFIQVKCSLFIDGNSEILKLMVFVNKLSGNWLEPCTALSFLHYFWSNINFTLTPLWIVFLLHCKCKFVGRRTNFFEVLVFNERKCR